MNDPEFIEKETKIYARCENCPNLGNHVHVRGELICIPNDQATYEESTFNGIFLNPLN